MYGYQACFEVISLYAPSVLDYFADGWNRMPAYPNAKIIQAQLGTARAGWRSRTTAGAQEIVSKIDKTMEAIQRSLVL